MKFTSSSVQENGQITLPATWRRKYGIQRGDAVFVEETNEGLLVRPQTSNLLYYLQKIGAGLKQWGISEEDMRANGRKIRGALLQEMYNLSEQGEVISR